MSSDEVKAANQAVGEALEGWVNALPWEGSPEKDAGILGDWLAVVCMVSVGPEGQPVAEYYLTMRDGTLLPHVAAGLLDVAMDQVGGNTIRNDD